MLVYSTGNPHNSKYIVNFPTKRHWREASRIEDVKAGLIDLANVIRSLNITSAAIPPLGCGLGGLNWSDVKPCIESALSRLPETRVALYEPGGSTPH
jgi:O-acetyl-ADP-ribose deacetylase (regulator of RNase III)